MQKIKRIKWLLFCFLILVFNSSINNLVEARRRNNVGKVNIALVKSADFKQYKEVTLGAKKNLAVEDYDLHIISVSRGLGEKQIENFIKKKQIRLVIALGERAAVLLARSDTKIPILFAMVLNYKRLKELNKKHITGISMEISSENLFTQFKLLHSGLKKLALPYHPDASQEIINDAKKSAPRSGISLFTMPLKRSNLLTKTLYNSRASFDSIWMISDFKLYNKNTMKEVRKFFSFANQNSKPIFVSSEAFLRAGGLFSVSIDYLSLGSQLALLTNRIIKNKEKVKKIKVATPIGTKTVLNVKVAQMLLDEGILNGVALEYPVDVILE